MNKNKFYLVLGAFITIMFCLTGCGGGGGSSSAPTQTQAQIDASKLTTLKKAEGSWTFSYTVGIPFTDNLTLSNVEKISLLTASNLDYGVTITPNDAFNPRIGAYSSAQDVWVISGGAFGSVPSGFTGGLEFKTDGNVVLPGGCFYRTNISTGVKSACYPLSGSKTSSTPPTPPPAVAGWSAGASKPTPSSWSASAVVGNDIYVIGGSGAFNVIEKYNTLTNLWSPIATPPFSDFSIRAATVNGKIYVFGILTTNVYRFDPSTGAWTKLNNMPGMMWMGTPAVVNNKVYIFGGYDLNANVVTKLSLEYDPSNDTWSNIAPMPTARYAPATAVHNNQIYVLGGNFGINKNEVYDPTTNTWQTKANIPFSNYGYGVAGTINGNIYFVNSDNNNMAVYNPALNIWAQLSGLSLSRNELTGEVVNGKLYVIGGATVATPTTNTNNVDIYLPFSQTAVFKSTVSKIAENQADYSAYYIQKHLAEFKLLLK